MKNLFVSHLILLISAFVQMFAQEDVKSFIINPFIGEKLDKVEETYFNIFPAINDLEEAYFYLGNDSLLTIKLKYSLNRRHIDTTTNMDLYQTLNNVNRKISKRLVYEINENNVKEFSVTLKNEKTFNGYVYTYKNGNIKLVTDEFVKAPDYNRQDRFIQEFNYAEIKNLQSNEGSFGFALLTSVLGCIGGGTIGASIGANMKSDEAFESLGNSIEGLVLGGALGLVIGYTLGTLVEFTEEYVIDDPGTRTLIMQNQLLPSGL